MSITFTHRNSKLSIQDIKLQSSGGEYHATTIILDMWHQRDIVSAFIHIPEMLLSSRNDDMTTTNQTEQTPNHVDASWDELWMERLWTTMQKM